ncbi:MAG: YdcF family protein [Candidatus Omnitrophota bacterium]|nr:YdcF family protein [Candidatus Omnitrophota bacterium]
MANPGDKRPGSSRLLIALFIIAIAAFSYKAWLPLPAKFLLVKDNIQKADCIVVLVGDLYLRFKKTVDLYNDGYAKNIVYSVIPEHGEYANDYFNFERRVRGLKEISEKELALRTFKYFGKDRGGIYFTDMTVTSTFEEAVAAKKIMLRNGYKSMILVTSAYHMRRALMLFRIVFRGTGIKIYNSTALNTLHDPPRWWLKEQEVKAIAEEYLSIAYNVIYHFILGKNRTSFDTI